MMDVDALIALAVKCRLGRVVGPIFRDEHDVFLTDASYRTHELIEFATAVAAAVKEEDARICDRLVNAIDHGGKKYKRPADAEHCAAAIRASIKEGK